MIEQRPDGWVVVLPCPNSPREMLSTFLQERTELDNWLNDFGNAILINWVDVGPTKYIEHSYFDTGPVWFARFKEFEDALAFELRFA